MFEINENIEIQEEIFEGSRIFVIDDFYKHPDSLVNYLKCIPAKIHGKRSPGSLNEVVFEDRRHIIQNQSINIPIDFLGSLVSKESLHRGIIYTNVTKFLSKTENDYENHYWWPHQDDGYNGIVYLNEDDDECGTNLYRVEDDSECGLIYKTVEHVEPWRKKEHYSILKTFKPKYNRLVFFDGFKFPHAMNICSDRYFGEEYRMNQVFFFRR